MVVVTFSITAGPVIRLPWRKPVAVIDHDRVEGTRGRAGRSAVCPCGGPGIGPVLGLRRERRLVVTPRRLRRILTISTAVSSSRRT